MIATSYYQLNRLGELYPWAINSITTSSNFLWRLPVMSAITSCDCDRIPSWFANYPAKVIT